ncbi:DNA replication licensing factor Mcm2 [Corchorus capsularis]|uniref:DNA replication licensing factor Mcm2 n=1 Tax=Corchorus capsularis TaxID=210143 RepID=A0A1R3G8M2_COCAP|nr:DNA replication licensing factor Mcm2 [Corchorus capsularis]
MTSTSQLGVGVDDSLEDERDLDQIMQDRRAAELELDTGDARLSNRKLPQLLHDQASRSKGVVLG